MGLPDHDELKIRPIGHQNGPRVRAHILVCFPAYVLWKTLAQYMRGAGLGDTRQTLVEEFAKIRSKDVLLPAQGVIGKTRTIRVRCVTTPGEAQRALLHRLGLTLPQRLRMVEEVTQT